MQLQTHSNVEVKGTFSSFEDIPYRQSDLFLYTSRFDGIPTVLLSALGAGMPVVAPRLGGIPEIVIDGVTGVLVDPHLSDEELIEAYVEAVRKIRSSASIRRSMGRAALKLIEEQHSPQRHLAVIKRNFFRLKHAINIQIECCVGGTSIKARHQYLVDNEEIVSRTKASCGNC